MQEHGAEKTLTDEVNILSGMNSLEGPLPKEVGEPELKNIVAVKRELKQ